MTENSIENDRVKIIIRAKLILNNNKINNKGIVNANIIDCRFKGM